VLSAEATNNKITVFGLTRSGVEPMIYHTRGKHANHYITNEVTKFWKDLNSPSMQQESVWLRSLTSDDKPYTANVSLHFGLFPPQVLCIVILEVLKNNVLLLIFLK
jgi:hypothetical protein